MSSSELTQRLRAVANFCECVKPPSGTGGFKEHDVACPYRVMLECADAMDEYETKLDRLQGELRGADDEIKYQENLRRQAESRLGEVERIAREWKDTSQFTHAKAALEKIESIARIAERQEQDSDWCVRCGESGHTLSEGCPAAAVERRWPEGHEDCFDRSNCPVCSQLGHHEFVPDRQEHGEDGTLK